MRQRTAAAAAKTPAKADVSEDADDNKALAPAKPWWGASDAIIAVIFLAVALYSRLWNIRDPKDEVFDETVRYVHAKARDVSIAPNQ